MPFLHVLIAVVVSRIPDEKSNDDDGNKRNHKYNNVFSLDLFSSPPPPSPKVSTLENFGVGFMNEGPLEKKIIKDRTAAEMGPS